MKLGLCGGSFDPVHRGHVDPVLEAVEAIGLDRVIYLPTAEPPHKAPRTASVQRRFAMVELALLGYENLLVSDFEMTPGRTAYTVETVRHFAAKEPEDDLYLILGSDSFVEFTGWRQWRQIAELATLVVLARPDGSAARLGEISDELDGLVQQDRVRFVENRPIQVASRSIRSTFAAGEEPPAGALAPLVLNYLRKYDLYR